MPFSLTWLPGVLKDAGLKVAVEFGWENRGHGDVGTILGVICHHTATNANGNMPTYQFLIEGDAKLPGPVAQLGLGRDGTYYVIAAGLCNHAGEGDWQGVTRGNTHFIGIEAENKGIPSDQWPDVQMDAYRRGVAAILKHIGNGTDFCVGHKEWARNRKNPKKRKDDPLFDMKVFRTSVAAILNGAVAPPVLIPSAEPAILPGGSTGRPTLRRGAIGELVQQIQAKLKINADGSFGPKTETALRAFQRVHGLVPDGIVGPKTWVSLDSAS